MKLGDILPHWIFRERAGIDAEIGGAAFAHLTESGGRITFDGQAIVADGGTVQTWLYPGELDLYGADPNVRALAIGLLDDAQDAARFWVKGDGSLHWGDGVSVPDVTLERVTGGWLQLTGGGAFVVGDGSADYSYMEQDGLYAENDTNGTSASLLSNGRMVLTANGHGAEAVPNAANYLQVSGVTGIELIETAGVLRMKSPNGTAYNITVANGGAVTSTPA